MKRFKLHGAGLTLAEQEIWQQAGFDLVLENVDTAIDENIAADILLSMGQAKWTPDLRKVFQLRPKLLLVRGDSAGQLPNDYQSLYIMRTFGEGNQRWVLGTILDTPLPEELNSLLIEMPLPALALAESLYYYLLRDVFKDTAEWCGHMSSVVGRM